MDAESFRPSLKRKKDTHTLFYEIKWKEIEYFEIRKERIGTNLKSSRKP
jgi:hypothetical protein